MHKLQNADGTAPRERRSRSLLLFRSRAGAGAAALLSVVSVYSVISAQRQLTIASNHEKRPSKMNQNTQLDRAGIVNEMPSATDVGAEHAFSASAPSVIAGSVTVAGVLPLLMATTV